MTINEMWRFYQKYEWKKCLYQTYNKRIKRLWLSFEEAIKPWHLMKKKNWIIDAKKKCKKCWIFKCYSDFSKMNNSYYSRCKECVKIARKIHYEKNKDKILQKKKEKRQTELWKLRTHLDKKFYSDKNIKRIIQIDWVKKRLKQKVKWEITKDKYLYFLNQGYDKDLLDKVYWYATT